MQLQYELSNGVALRSCTVNILSFTASICGPDHVIDAVRDAFPAVPAWPLPIRGSVQRNLRVSPAGHGDGVWRVVEDDSTMHECCGLTDLQALLVWLIISQAVEQLGRDHLLFHAGSIAIGDVGVILPAASGSGKSTLTAALIAHGCAYYSDEVAVIAPHTGLLLPFPKALKIEPESIPVLANLYPELTAIMSGSAHSGDQPIYLHPPATSWPGGPVAPQYVIFPRYQAGAITRLDPLSRGSAFERLIAHSFSAGSLAAEGVHQIVRLLRGCTCYDLTMGDLDDAVSQIIALAG